MKFTIIETNGDEKVVFCKTPKVKTLGELFKGHHNDIKSLQVNGTFVDEWQNHEFDKKDSIHVYSTSGDFTGILINILLSLAFSALASLFTKKPKKPSTSKSQPSVGVAGIQNTIAPGTPKFFSYGIRRIAGHLIGSQVDLIEPVDGGPDTGKKMTFRALYFMGVGQVCCISDVKINDTHMEDIPGPVLSNTRLGTSDQSLITGWTYCHQTYEDNRTVEIPLRPGTSTSRLAGAGQAIVYTTKSSNVNKVTLFFNFPSGLWQLGVHGATYPNYVQLKILRKKNSQSEGFWVNLGTFQSVTTSTQNGFFWKVDIECPEASKWDFQINVEKQRGHGSYGQGPSMSLFNVMETMYITTTYPGNALLEINGVGNDQLTGFDNMETSALVEGRLVEVPNNGIYTKQCSRNRVWIIRDILLNSDIGLGNRIDPSLWDTASAQVAANYYEETVTGFDGVTEQRDYCDVIINEVKPGWDWIKILLFEGRAALIPSGGKWKYILDKDKTPSLLYSYPGNIISDSLQYQLGNSDKEINTITSEFPDIDNDYKVVPTILVSSTRGTDPERPQDLSYTSLVRKSQVSREMNFYLKQKTLVKKRWNWKSPRTAIVSEPFDVDYLSYQTSKNLRGYTGFIEGGASTTRIPIGKSVYISSGITYSVHVRQGNTVEERNLTNVAGETYSVLTLASALSFTPEVGDIWSVGSVEVHKVKIQTEEVEFDGENFKITAHEHIPDVYTDVLTDVSALQNGAGTTSNSPRPLIKAQVELTSILGITVAHFSVVPSFNSFVGDYTLIGTNTIFLASSEPHVDDFFNDAYITADGEGELKILDYLGDTQEAIVEDPGFLTATTNGGSYTIEWSGKSPYYGFRVEGSTDAAGPFNTTGITPTFINGDTDFYTTAMFSAATYSYIRFTPFNANSEDNLSARWITGIGVTETSAPLPPVYIDMSSDNKNVSAFFRFAAPVERDLSKISVTFYQDSPLTGTTASVATDVDVSSMRDDTVTFRAASYNLTLDNQNYGDSIFAKISSKDFFGNESPSAISILGTTLSSTPTNDYSSIDIEDNATEVTITGTNNTTIYSGTVSGGNIVPPSDSVRIDTLMTITPGSTVATDITFEYSFGGTTISSLTASISDGVSKIPDETPYWLTFIVDPLSTTSQRTKAFGYGLEVSDTLLRSDLGTASADTNQDQTIALAAQISVAGSTITVHRSILRSIIYTINIPDASSIPFTPGSTSSWVGSDGTSIVPDTVGGALDNLGDRTTTLEGSVGTLQDSQLYIISGSILGKPDSNTIMLVHPVAENMSIAAGGGQSHGYANTAAVAAATFTLLKNGSSFGSMGFLAGGTTAIFSIANTVSFLQSNNDYLTVLSPNPADSTLADIGFALYGKR